MAQRLTLRTVCSAVGYLVRLGGYARRKSNDISQHGTGEGRSENVFESEGMTAQYVLTKAGAVFGKQGTH